MLSRDWLKPVRPTLCPPAAELAELAEAIITDLTHAKPLTPAMVKAALEAIRQFRDELTPELSPLHFGVLVGRHRCVPVVYHLATARLRGLIVTPPPPTPPPSPQPLTDAELMAYVERWSAESTKGTFFGSEEDGDRQQ